MAKTNYAVLPFIQHKLLVAFCLFILFALISCHEKNGTKTNMAAGDSVQPAKNIRTLGDSDVSVFKSKDSLNQDWLLQPGISAGQTKIGEGADSVYARLGKPDASDAAMMKAVAIWFAHHDTTGNSIAIYTARNTDSGAVARVLQIRITSPSFKTKDGIGTTSFLSDIQKRFDVKKTEEYVDADHKYEVYDCLQGIAFEMNQENKKCVAIVIHKAGKMGEGTYLKFRTTNKCIDRVM